MRCFISINLDETVKKEIDAAIRQLKPANSDVKWVSADNTHITLKFLGNIGEDIVEGLKEKLSLVVGRHDSFRINLHGVGLFPDKRRPRVVCVNLIDTQALKELQVHVEESAVSIGLSKENRPFSPHLTIGRIKSSIRHNSLFNMIEALKDKDFGNIEADRIYLMKSDLKPTGAEYSILAEFQLRRTKNEQ